MRLRFEPGQTMNHPPRTSRLLLRGATLAIAVGLVSAAPGRAQEAAIAPVQGGETRPALQPSTAVGQAIQILLGAETPTPEMTAFGERLNDRWVSVEALREFYARDGYEPIWTDSPEAKQRAAAVLEVLQEAPQHGLDPAEYEGPALAARVDATDPTRLAEFDLLLSAAYVNYYGDLGEGRTSPRKLHPEEYGYRRALNPVEVLHKATVSLDPAESLRLQAPRARLYAGLQQALHTYDALAAQGGWPTLPEGPALAPGDKHDQVALLRQRLRASGDLGGPANEPQAGATTVSLEPGADPRLYDPALEQAVRAFQTRHGLEADGVVGAGTRAALNVPVEDRVNQILMNMERVRWMPNDFGQRHVLVNTAAYTVEVVEDGRPVLTMAAIVGERYNQTPVFSDVIRYLEFNPFWNIPPSIAQEEIGPKVMQDPTYLARNHIRVLNGYDEGAKEFDPATVDWSNLGEDSPYRLRQDPGPDNPLGDVKFMFPNDFAVYLHDTPGDQLFEELDRAFSHGCVRVSKPVELAAYLLAGQDDWTAEKIAAVMKGDERQIVDLMRPIAVHLTYLTAWVDFDGALQFREDVYGRDAKLGPAMFKTASAE